MVVKVTPANLYLSAKNSSYKTQVFSKVINHIAHIYIPFRMSSKQIYVGIINLKDS